MDVDLLIAGDGQAALIFDQGFHKGRVNVIGLNPDDLTLVLLFERGERATLNIPVQPGCAERLRNTEEMHLALVAGHAITAVKQVPFVPNIPGWPRRPPAPPSVWRFAQFLAQPLESQPVHRDQVGDESSARSLAHQVATGKLPLAPKLEDERRKEVAAAPSLQYEPRAPKPTWIGRTKSPRRPRKGAYKPRERRDEHET